MKIKQHNIYDIYFSFAIDIRAFSLGRVQTAVFGATMLAGNS